MTEKDKAWHIINELIVGMNIKDARWKTAATWLSENRPKELVGKMPYKGK